MRLLPVALLAATAAISFAPAASAQKPNKPPGQQAITLQANANPVTFSVPLVLSGSVKGANAGTSVTIQRRDPTSTTFTTAGAATTNDKGDFTLTLRPRANTVYRAVLTATPATTSSELLVKVAPLVGFTVSDSSVRRGARVVFRGTVRPAHDGRNVQIQRKRADGSWATIARTALTDAGSTYSKYRRALTVRTTATYRVRVLGHHDHALGTSRERTITVG